MVTHVLQVGFVFFGGFEGQRVSTDGLVVVDADPLVNLPLNQRLHDGTVHVAKETASLVVFLGNDNEAVVVQHVTIQVVREATLLTRTARALIKMLISV